MVSVTLDVCHRGGWKVQLGHEGLKQANTPIVVGRDRSPRGLYVPGDPGHRAGRRAGGPGAVFAKARDQAAGLFQIRAFRVPGMKHQRHFGSANVIPLREVAQIGAFIGDLDRRAQLLDHDIAAEEERAQVFNPFDAAYPVLARKLAASRDNLKATVATLEKRLVELQGRTQGH
jgi:hypothetical protein